MTCIQPLPKCVIERATISSIIGTAILICLLVGCKSELETVPVNGQVLYQGQPLTYGSVMFQPEGSGPLARGTIQRDGTFDLGTRSENDGVRPGKCRVRITAYSTQQAASQQVGEQELVLGKSAIPEKYQNFGTSGLIIEVQPDMQLPLAIDLD